MMDSYLINYGQSPIAFLEFAEAEQSEFLV